MIHQIFLNPYPSELNFRIIVDYHVIPDQIYLNIFVPLDILQRCNTTLLYYIHIFLKIHPRL